MHTITSRRLAVVIVLLLGFAACGGDKDEQAGSTGAGSSTTRPGSATTIAGGDVQTGGGAATTVDPATGGTGDSTPSDGSAPNVEAGELPNTPLSDEGNEQPPAGQGGPNLPVPTTEYIAPRSALNVCQVVPLAEVNAASGFTLETAAETVDGNRGECRYERPGGEAVVVSVEDFGSVSVAIRSNPAKAQKPTLVKGVADSAVTYDTGDTNLQARKGHFVMYVSIIAADLPRPDQNAKAVEVAKKAIPLVDVAFQ